MRNKSSLYYKIYCKQCETINCYDFTEYELINDGSLYLNCHFCNDYAIVINNNNNTIYESYRHGNDTLDKNPPRFEFLPERKDQ